QEGNVCHRPCFRCHVCGETIAACAACSICIGCEEVVEDACAGNPCYWCDNCGVNDGSHRTTRDTADKTHGGSQRDRFFQSIA
uniref:Turripeptide OL139 n=1 Tax=Iotyrris olangoensis TaxID=2420066 RepID=TU139_IOTOL|nr:RecName: Full=Turripeptide OL139 [Iotyrris olangoensis]